MQAEAGDDRGLDARCGPMRRVARRADSEGRRCGDLIIELGDDNDDFRRMALPEGRATDQTARRSAVRLSDRVCAPMDIGAGGEEELGFPVTCKSRVEDAVRGIWENDADMPYTHQYIPRVTRSATMSGR